jgi:hypothetical protein
MWALKKFVAMVKKFSSFLLSQLTFLASFTMGIRKKLAGYLVKKGSWLVYLS